MNTIFVSGYDIFATEIITDLCDGFFQKENHQTIINLLDDEDIASTIYMIGEDEEGEVYISLTHNENWKHIERC